MGIPKAKRLRLDKLDTQQALESIEKEFNALWDELRTPRSIFRKVRQLPLEPFEGEVVLSDIDPFTKFKLPTHAVLYLALRNPETNKVEWTIYGYGFEKAKTQEK